MRNFEKDLIFWYGLHKIAGDDMKLHYLVSTEKEYLFHLANITFYGLQQYTLYSGDKLTLIDDTEYSKFRIILLITKNCYTVSDSDTTPKRSQN
jgi:hypothetical protein